MKKVYRLNSYYAESILKNFRESCIMILCPTCKAAIGQLCYGESVHLSRFSAKFTVTNMDIKSFLKLTDQE